MGFTLETGVPVFTVFLQGLLSFFSPCVLPLVPLYIGYLAGGAKSVAPDGSIRYPRGKMVLHTLFFVLGISFTFFLLGFGFTALGRFFTDNRIWFARVSGMVMIGFGLYQLGIFGRSKTVEQERRLPLRLNRLAMNPLTAFLLGFTFSFAWTPCVGPTLGSVLLMASSSNSSFRGFLLIGVYTLGFVLPFLAVGLFTTAVLGFFKKHRNVVKYTVKTGAVLLILMGMMTLTGFMNGITSYLSSPRETADSSAVSSDYSELESSSPAEPGSSISSKNQAEHSSQQKAQSAAAPDFTLTDQYGTTHTLSEYRGKTIFLNFWATWCPPCKREMPDIQALYESYGSNSGDLIVLGVANPKSPGYPHNQDNPQEYVEEFLQENGYTFPVVMDTTGEVFSQFGIYSFPTTFMIDKDGNVFGYVTSSLSADMMENIVRQTMEGKHAQ